MHPRTVALVGALSLVAGWGLGLRFAPPDPGSGPGAAGSRGARPLGVEQTHNPAPLTEQLRRRLDQQPQSPRPSRNPFVFGSRRAVPTPGRGDERILPSEPPIAEAPPPRAPSLTLSGIASSNGPEGVQHIAILSDGHGLLYVSAGDVLPGGDAVVAVQETMVILRDSSGEERTLRLR